MYAHAPNPLSGEQKGKTKDTEKTPLCSKVLMIKNWF